MLWHIQGSKTRIFGSIHATNVVRFRRSSTESDVFEEAERAIFESDFGQQPDLSETLLPGNVRFDECVPAATLNATLAHYRRLGLMERDALSVKPSVAALQLMVAQITHAGYSMQGVDAQLREDAERAGKQLAYLETASEAVGVFSKAPLAEQVAFLTHVASKADACLSEFVEILTAWERRDTKFFESLLSSRIELMPETMAELVWQRNKNWIPHIIDAAARSDRTLVVVGALHLVSPIGIPNLLAQAGLRCVRIA